MDKRKLPAAAVTDLYPRSFRAVGRAGIGVQCHFFTARNRWHRHNGFMEIVVCCGGGACCEMESGGFLLRPGDVLFFPEGTVHCYTGIRSFRYYNLLFGPELFTVAAGVFPALPRIRDRFFPSGATLTRKLLPESDLPALVTILESMRSEYLNRQDGWEDVFYAECVQALIFLARHTLDEGGRTAGAFEIVRAVRLMEKSACAGISVRQVAKAVRMSESSFRHRFRALTGMAPMTYLFKLRLRRAVMALVAGMSVSAAAEQGGFSNVSYFCRRFQQRFRLTPMTFRRRVNGGEIDPAEFLDAPWSGGDADKLRKI